MLNGFRRGTSPGRPLANLFSFGEGAARIRAEQRKAALRRSSILSSRLSVEALEPRLLLSADVAPIDVGLGLGLPSGLVASMEPSAKFLTVMPFDGAGAGTGIGGIAPGIDMSALSVRVGGYALDVDGADTASGFYAHGGSGGSGSAGAPGTTAALTTFGGADGEGEGISLLSLSAPTAVPPVTGSLDVPGATQSFTFTLTEARKVYFDSLTDRSNIRWSLVGPNGTLVNGRAFGASDSIDISGSNILDLAAGDYRLTVDGDGDATGAFAFRLLDIANAAPIQAGALVSAQNEGRATDLYAFDAVAGERYFFDRQTLTGGTVSWRLIGPDGEYVRGPDYYNDSGVFALDRTGTYTLAIEGVDSNSAAFDYGFILSRVTATEAALTPGELVRGRIEGAGDTITYIFDLAGETRLLFDALRDDRGFQWSLAGPRGTVVDGRYFWNSEGSSGQPLLALPAGRYRLTVGGGGSDARGDFAFRLLDAGAAQD
ncbi:MAG: LEPR-XLL domain-containing protein, partial [Sphingopyxis granuli]